ncbi:hypothetical protein HKX48_000097, partial [Thoreauomyces humboldtii]
YFIGVQRSSFLVSAGFAREDNRDLIVVGTGGQPGLICKYSAGAVDPTNSSSVTNQLCQYFWVDSVQSDLSVMSHYTYFPGEPPAFSNASAPYWDVLPYFIQTGDSWLGVLSFHWNQWRGQPLGYSSDTSIAIGAQLVTVSFEIFSTLLNTISCTPNTAIAIWLTGCGGMIGNNKNLSVLDPGTEQNIFAAPYFPDTMPQTYIREAAVALKTEYGDIFGAGYQYPTALLPVRTSNRYNLAVGACYVETYTLVDAYGFDVTIMLVIPEDDLLGPMKSTRKKVLGSSIGIAAGMLALAAATSALVTRPVRRLTAIMGQATNMDFTALQGGYLENKSRILELAKMQEVFGTMLKRFAAAIQANKNLNTGTRMTGQNSANAPPTSGVGRSQSRPMNSPH